MAVDRPLPGQDKSPRVEVDYPVEIKHAGGVPEAAGAAGDDRGFHVEIDSRRRRGDQLPHKRTGDSVAVGRNPVKGAGVTSIAEVRDKVCAAGEVSQDIGISRIGHGKAKNAAARAGDRRAQVCRYGSGDGALERDLVIVLVVGYCRSGVRGSRYERNSAA